MCSWCTFTPCSFHYLSQNNSKYPIQTIFWSVTSLQLRCFSKSGHFASRLRSSRHSGFSAKIGTVPPKSGRLDTAVNTFCSRFSFTCKSISFHENKVMVKLVIVLVIDIEQLFHERALDTSF